MRIADANDNNQPVTGADVINSGVAGFFEIADLPYSYSKFSRLHLSEMREWILDWEHVFSKQRLHSRDKATFVIHEPLSPSPLFAFSLALSVQDRYCAITHVERSPALEPGLFGAALAIDCAHAVAFVATQTYPASKPFSVGIQKPLDEVLPYYQKIIIENYKATPVWDPVKRLLTIA